MKEQFENDKDIENLNELADSLNKTIESERIKYTFSKGIENAFNLWFEDTKT